MAAKKGGNVADASYDEAESEIGPALLACYDIAGRAPKFNPRNLGKTSSVRIDERYPERPSPTVMIP